MAADDPGEADAGDGTVAAGEVSTRAPVARRHRMPRFGRGTVIARYVVVDLLGAGGMGDVYAAYDPDLDRRIALKMVRDLSGAGRDRLIVEAKAMARVAHPNVVAVHDVGRFGDGVFIAMELVDGVTLTAWRKQPRTRAEILAVFDAAGRGLAAAHEAGVVHRDFKPGNVIVGRDGRTRVLDFGLARRGDDGRGVDTGAALATSRRDDAEPTASMPDADADADPDAGGPRVLASRVMGTPSYMAPEQHRTGVVDARVDQFSFAVALYETLYGERPFAGDDAETIAINAALGAVRPPPRTADVPTWLRRVLVRALDPEPIERYPSMPALLAALARDVTRRRRRIGVAVAALGVVSVVGFGLLRPAAAPPPCRAAGAAAAQQWNPSAHARVAAAFTAVRPAGAAWTERVALRLDERARAWTAARIATCEATAVRHEQSAALLDVRMACLDRRLGELAALIRALGEADRALMDGALDAIAALPALDHCADRDGLLAIQPPPADPDRRARIRIAEDAVAEVRARERTAAVDQERARADGMLTLARATGYPPLIAEALVVWARAGRRGNDGATAETALYEATELAAAARAERTLADAWTDAVVVLGVDLGRPREALVAVRAARAALARLGWPALPTAALLHAEALALTAAGDFATAATREEEALALRIAALGDRDLVVTDSLNQLAHVRSRQGDHAGAEVLYRRALELRRAALGDTHPDVAATLNNLGAVLYHQGRFDEAAVLYQEALGLRIAALGVDDDEVGATLNNLGGLYLDRGDLVTADDYFTRALANWERGLGADHPDLAIPLGNLGDVALRRGDPARARGLCQRAYALEAKASGADSIELGYALTCRGEAELGAGAAPASVETLERALALRERGAVDPGELARTRLALARALEATGGADDRARQLAIAARDGFAAAGVPWATRHAEAVAVVRRLR